MGPAAFGVPGVFSIARHAARRRRKALQGVSRIWMAQGIRTKKERFYGPPTDFEALRAKNYGPAAQWCSCPPRSAKHRFICTLFCGSNHETILYQA